MAKRKTKTLVTPTLEKTQPLPLRVKSSRDIKEMRGNKPVSPGTFSQTFAPQLIGVIASPKSTNLDKIVERGPTKVTGSKGRPKENVMTQASVLETESAQSGQDFAMQAKRLSKGFAELRQKRTPGRVS